jgi:hypothetical protein
LYSTRNASNCRRWAAQEFPFVGANPTFYIPFLQHDKGRLFANIRVRFRERSNRIETVAHVA